MAGYTLQTKTDGDEMTDIPLAATYDSAGNEIINTYAAQQEYQDIKDKLETMSGQLDEILNATGTTKIILTDDASENWKNINDNWDKHPVAVVPDGLKTVPFAEGTYPIVKDINNRYRVIGYENYGIMSYSLSAGTGSVTAQSTYINEIVTSDINIIAACIRQLPRDAAKYLYYWDKNHNMISKVAWREDVVSDELTRYIFYSPVFEGDEASGEYNSDYGHASIIRYIVMYNTVEEVAVDFLRQVFPIWLTEGGNYLKVPNFSVATPKEIDVYSRSGLGSLIWTVGSRTTITLKSGKTISVRILGFNHDDLADGSGKAGITLGMVDCLDTKYTMNDNASGMYYWPEVKMRQTLQELYNDLPDDWQAVIKPVTKITANAESSLGSTTEKLFLLSEYEVLGRKILSWGQNGKTEGIRYEWCEKNCDNATNLIKKVGGVAASYWLRSPSNRGGYVIFDEAGALMYNKENTELGVSYAFCV